MLGVLLKKAYRYGHEPQNENEDSVVRSAKGLAIDEISGILFVVDSNRNRIVLFEIATGVFLRSIGRYGVGPGLFWIPVDIAMYRFETGPALLYVTERLNRR